VNDWNYATPTVPLDLRNLKTLESLDLSNTCLQELPILPTTLKHLNLSKMRHLGGHSIGDETYELPLLESFDCSGTAISRHMVKAVTLQSIKAGKLKKLYMGDRLTEFLPGTAVEDEYPASNSVEELSLASLIIRERRILEVIKLYPNLERLDVSGTKITGVAVKQLVQMGVKWLKLDECSEVSPDAVEYARGKGVDVQFNFPSRSGRATSFRDASYTGVF
jgi:F-box/TPR repeat protein Pof3